MTRATLIAFFALVACSKDDTQPPPNPPLTTEAGVPAPAAATRTIGHRHPFGDTFQANNLMVDGDFELTGRGTEPSEPWIVFNNSGQQTLNYETGGHCRSGIRCGSFTPDEQLVGYMASPPAEDAVIRAYVKPDSGHCPDAQIFVFDFVTGGFSASAQATTNDPAEDGWCFFTGKVPNLAYEQPALFIEFASSAKAKSIIVDQVSVLPLSQTPIHGIVPPYSPPSAATRARGEAAAKWIRTHRRYGRNTEPQAP